MRPEYMSYEDYLVNLRKGILTKDGNCPVTPLLLMLQGCGYRALLYRSYIPEEPDTVVYAGVRTGYQQLALLMEKDTFRYIIQ